jgi:uncharacterized damage-inducible protein DinB
MTTREFYLQRRQAELPAFLRVLKALPKDRLSYKPHERSPSAEQLVWTLTRELDSCLDVVREHRSERKVQQPLPVDQMLQLFGERANELVDRVSGMNEESWERFAQLYFNGKLVFEQPTGEYLWMIHFDAIHHRGQLSAYLRPMGAKVPSIYGPSADESLM